MKPPSPDVAARVAPAPAVPAAAWVLPGDWQRLLAPELAQPYMRELAAFLQDERRAHTVYPAEDEQLSALALTPPARTRVVVLGQDPYHGPGQAHGLAFSVKPGVPPPPSLANVFRELRADLQVPPPTSGSLVPWAKQGVLLLNTVLTVRAGEAHSHRNRGWERFTDAVIRALAARPDPLVFVLWGKPAQAKARLLQGAPQHSVLMGAHPSPLSAHTGFLGSRPFSTINRILTERGQPPIDWRLP